jgi:hypothetical protein
MKKYIPVFLLVCITLCSGCELVTDEPEKGKVNYLCIGELYKEKPNSALSYTVADATSMIATLDHAIEATGRTKGEAYSLIEGVDGTSYTSGTETWTYISKADAEGKIEDLQDNASTDDLTIIYYSGHGVESDTDTSYTGALVFLEKDGNYFNWQYLKPFTLMEEVNGIPGKKLIVLDSCYSGEVSDIYGVTACTSTGASIFDAYFSDETEDWNNLFTLTASTSQTESAEYRTLEHGAFTYALLQGMGWENDTTFTDPPAVSGKYLSVDSLYDYIDDNCLNSSQQVTANGTADNLILFTY